MKRLFFSLASLIIVSSFAQLSYAGDTGYRTILEFGCHKVNTICYITIDGDPPSVPGCTSNSVRWDAANDPNGKNWIAMIIFAMATDRKINLYIDSCLPAQSTYPTFSWGTLEP